MSEGGIAALQQFLLLVGTLILVGCATWRFIVAPRAAAHLGNADRSGLLDRERRASGVGLTVALLLLPVWGLRLVVQVMGFRDPFVPLSEDVSFLVRETTWGTVWLLQGAVLVLIPLAFLAARRTIGTASSSNEARTLRSSPGWWGAATLTGLLLLTLSLSSHAMGVESGRAIAVSADALHAFAGGAWMGSLALILAFGRRAPGGGDLFAAQLRAFSPLAIACVTALVVMGVGLSWVHLSTPADLWNSTYGRILSAKVLLAGAAFLLGLLNWRRGLPVMGTPEGNRRVRIQAGWEVFVAVGVLLLTAILTQTPKPGAFG